MEKPTHRGTIRADIDRAIRASTTERDFLRVLDEMGYQVKTHGKDGKLLKYPALKPPDAKGYFRFHKLGEGYTLEEIRARILRNIYKQPPFPELVHHLPQHYRVRGKPQKKSPVCGRCTSATAMNSTSSSSVRHPVKRVSFLLREDIAKLDRAGRRNPLFGETPHRNDGGVELPTGKRHWWRWKP